jgi:hypothetical protein
MTLALAILGAVTGTAATLLDLLRYAFDRPRLIVGFNVTRSVEVPAMVGIDVTNRGRRPTTILKAAFRPDVEAELRHPESGAVAASVAASWTIDLTLSEEPTVIAAHGGVRRFRTPLNEWPSPIHADVPLRAYVIDSYANRPTWGPAPPILRMLLNNGWQPTGAPPGALDPAGPIRPQRVEPRWKLWKPKDLRNPQLPPKAAWPPVTRERR